VLLNVVPAGVAIWAKFEQPAPGQLSTWYPVTPTLSVAAVQLRLIWLLFTAPALSPVTVLGGVVSGTVPTGSSTLVEVCSPLLSVAVRMISYENVPIGPWSWTTKLPWAPVAPMKVCTWALWCSRIVHVSALAGRTPLSGSVAEP
jgi:hypothetical protein